MKTKEFETIERKLLVFFPQFTVKGKLLFIQPMKDVLRGVYFENSSGTNDFYVRVLYLPLFVPQEEINFIHGDRIRRSTGEIWRADEPDVLEKLRAAIEEKAIPFLNNISSLAGVLESVKADVTRDWPSVNSHHLETLAYLFVKTGEFSAALEYLADLKGRLSDSTTPWVVQQRNRAETIEEKLLQNPETALAYLDEWRALSIRNLKLEQYC